MNPVDVPYQMNNDKEPVIIYTYTGEECDGAKRAGGGGNIFIFHKGGG